jgi:hypothetical protein
MAAIGHGVAWFPMQRTDSDDDVEASAGLLCRFVWKSLGLPRSAPTLARLRSQLTGSVERTELPGDAPAYLSLKENLAKQWHA